MLKSIISSVGLILLLVNIANATIIQEVVPVRSALSPLFYIFVFFIMAIVGLVIFFIKKLDYRLNQILRSVAISLLITLGIELLLVVIASPGILDVTSWRDMVAACRIQPFECKTPFMIVLDIIPLAPIIFLLTILIYYIIKFIKSK